MGACSKQENQQGSDRTGHGFYSKCSGEPLKVKQQYRDLIFSLKSWLWWLVVNGWVRDGEAVGALLVGD